MISEGGPGDKVGASRAPRGGIKGGVQPLIEGTITQYLTRLGPKARRISSLGAIELGSGTSPKPQAAKLVARLVGELDAAKAEIAQLTENIKVRGFHAWGY